jgi:glycosyltransferase involved in cell wall biosynthesis
MRIGLIAPPWVAVPPPAYGGTEAVVDRLARGCTLAGHEVILFTLGESTSPVTRLWRYEHAVEPMENSLLELAHVLSAYDALADVDLIHDHTLLGPVVALSRRRRPPVVSTIHSPFTPDTRTAHRASAGRVPLICISHDQRAAAPEIPVAAVIHHGIDVEDFPPGDGSGGYLVFLGRMSPDKGAHRAIAVARAAGVPLKIAAKMREKAERRYFKAEIEPLLGGGVEFVGEVDARGRLDLLRGARALLNPIQWPEPFGLVMIEALACATPVIAQAIGSCPEIVDEGRTGFLCQDEDEMVAAVGRLGEIQRADCRETASRRFSTQRMVAEHLELYRTVVDAAAAASRAPATTPLAGADS